MVRYRPYVDAVQWIGTNVTEIRQFVRANTGLINDAVIRDGVLYLVPNSATAALGLPILDIVVPLNSWAVRANATISSYTTAEFDLLFELDT